MPTAGPVCGDITSPADLDRLLRHFYASAFADELLGHVFVDVVAMDLEAHLPAITAFWQKVLLGTGQYTGRPLAQHRAVHAQVPLTEAHFTRWLGLWRASLDTHFTGPVTERAYSHATQTAKNFLANLNAIEPARSMPLLPADQGTRLPPCP
ncbi:MAG: hypothetical protein JWM64_1053 [Frankiales bacterium]|nr:hypothetical protein [Frankiales bacterium]